MTKQAVYQVEKICGHRRKGGQYEFLIKWEGYSLEQATYEPAKNILDKQMLKKYQEKHITIQNKTPVKKSISKTPKKSSAARVTPKKVKPTKHSSSSKKSTPQKATTAKSIKNHQKEVSKLLQKGNISSIKNVFKQQGQVVYNVTIGKSTTQYLVSSSQLTKATKPELVVKFYESLIN